jgi:transcriptional regulator with XRE-family HTH domain
VTLSTEKVTLLPSELKNIRINRKLSQKEMAEQLGITRPALTQYENGSRTIPLYIVKLIQALFPIKLSGNIVTDINNAYVTKNNIEDILNKINRLEEENKRLRKMLDNIRSISSQVDDE